MGRRQGRAGAMGWLAAGCLALAGGLSGCSLGGEKAEAAPATRVETLRVQADSLVLVSDSPPEVEVSDAATAYRLVAGTDLLVTLAPGGGLSLSLRAGDVVVERPASGYLTVVRAQ